MAECVPEPFAARNVAQGTECRLDPSLPAHLQAQKGPEQAAGKWAVAQATYTSG